MAIKYFDSFEFRQAIELMEIDPFSSISLFEIYLEKYPKDYCAYLFYCCNLITIGKIDEAEKIYNYVEDIYNNDNKFQKIDKSMRTKQDLILTKLKLLSYTGRYEELYKLCINNKNIVKDNVIQRTLFYAKKKTGRLNPEKRDENSYLFSQMVRYEETDFLNHIKKHLYNTEEFIEKPSDAIFEPSFQTEKVIEEMKKYIPSNKKLSPGFYSNIYFFKYDNCGRLNNKMVDYFEVVCFDNTNEFITMWPVDDIKNMPYVDLNYLVDYNEKPKISQIEKFNKRFNKK